jgi:hypothetical protein
MIESVIIGLAVIVVLFLSEPHSSLLAAEGGWGLF